MLEASEWTALILKLRQLTDMEKLRWELQSPSGRLSTEINDTTYLIEARDDDNSAPFVLRIRTGSETDWVEVDSLLSTAGFETSWEPGTLVIPLMDAASRAARGGSRVVAKLLADLNAIDPSDPDSADDSSF